MWIGFKKFFEGKYHDLNITKKLSAGQTGYQSVNDVVLPGEIASALKNLALAATAYQSHVDQLMEKIRQMAETNKILGYQIKHLAETNTILARQGQEKKNNQIKPRVTWKTGPERVWMDTWLEGHQGS